MKIVLSILAFVLLLSFDASAQRKRFTTPEKVVIIDDSLRVGSKSTFNGVIDYVATFCDTNAFTTTATLDTVVISGVLGTDKVFITVRSQAAVADSSGVVYATVKTDTLFVARESGTASALKYQYLIIR